MAGRRFDLLAAAAVRVSIDEKEREIVVYLRTHAQTLLRAHHFLPLIIMRHFTMNVVLGFVGQLT